MLSIGIQYVAQDLQTTEVRSKILSQKCTHFVPNLIKSVVHIKRPIKNWISWINLVLTPGHPRIITYVYLVTLHPGKANPFYNHSHILKIAINCFAVLMLSLWH